MHVAPPRKRMLREVVMARGILVVLWSLLVFLYLSPFSLASVVTLPYPRALVDTWDISVYYRSSEWVSGSGYLYSEVPSEYPVAANLVFAACRYVTEHLHGSTPSQEYFLSLWVVATGSILFLYLYHRVYQGGWWPLFLWLTPAALYFSVLRFDLYPALLTACAISFLAKERLIPAVAIFGVAAAFKGYAFVFLPSLMVYAFLKRGGRAACLTAALFSLPFILLQASVIFWAGWEGAEKPFVFHLRRTFNDESFYQSIKYVVSLLSPEQSMALLDILFVHYRGCWLLQGLFAGACIIIRPRNHHALLTSMLIALMGFIIFNTFGSPQYLLWYLPLVIALPYRALHLLFVLVGIEAYLYFPILYDMKWEPYLSISRVVQNGLRLLILGVALYYAFIQTENDGATRASAT